MQLNGLSLWVAPALRVLIKVRIRVQLHVSPLGHALTSVDMSYARQQVLPYVGQIHRFHARIRILCTTTTHLREEKRRDRINATHHPMSNVLAILWTLELQCHPALKINKNDEPFVQLIRRYTVASFAEMASPFCTSASNLSWNLALSPALLVSCLSLQNSCLYPYTYSIRRTAVGIPRGYFLRSHSYRITRDVLIVQECNFTDTESAQRGRRIYEHTSYIPYTHLVLQV